MHLMTEIEHIQGYISGHAKEEERRAREFLKAITLQDTDPVLCALRAIFPQHFVPTEHVSVMNERPTMGTA